ncbi:MAG TPA: hypothetical protein VIV11_12375 [Kofleriaceae bacterium]
MSSSALVLVLLLAACKSDSSKPTAGGSAAPNAEPAAGGEAIGEAPGGAVKTTPKGAAYLAQLAAHLEQKACRCADLDCFRAAQSVITYDQAMDDELGPADRERNEWLKNREIGCHMRVTEPEDAKKLIANVAITKKKRDEALAEIAAPYSIETAKPKGKAELERYDKLRRDMCACTTIACTQKLGEDVGVNGEAMVDMTDRDRERYSKLLQAHVACNVATVTADMAQYIRDP